MVVDAVNETDHTVNDLECFIPSSPSPWGVSFGQTPAASCSSQEANEHWQPEWASDESASRGRYTCARRDVLWFFGRGGDAITIQKTNSTVGARRETRGRLNNVPLLDTLRRSEKA